MGYLSVQTDLSLSTLLVLTDGQLKVLLLFLYHPTFHNGYFQASTWRYVYPVVPHKVEYELTDIGKSVLPIVLDIAQWGIEIANPQDHKI